MGDIGRTYSSLEDTLVAPIRIRGLVDFILGRLRIDNAILAGDLLPVPLLVLLLLLDELLDLGFILVVERLELALLEVEGAVRGALGVGLDLPDLVADARVEQLRLAYELLELSLGGPVAACEGALVELGDLADAVGEGLDLAADGRHPREVLLLA